MSFTGCPCFAQAQNLNFYIDKNNDVLLNASLKPNIMKTPTRRLITDASGVLLHLTQPTIQTCHQRIATYF